VETLFARVAVVAALVAAVGALSVGAGGATASGNPARAISAENPLESRVLVALNAERRAHGLASLRLSTPLSAAADAHSHSMGTYGFFGHESRDGRSLRDRVGRYYGRGGNWLAGENLLWSTPSVEASQAVRLWMASPSHRRNILSARWRDIGLSAVSVPAAPGVFDGRRVVLVTATFGVRW
jgi:uncharacterized protein YkwD